MAITQRLRFEILRRDNYTCRYCGAAAPTAEITVDHVVAVSLGGSDDPSNLVAACAACNLGKASTTVDSTTADDISDLARVWSAFISDALADWRAERDAARADQEHFIERWNAWQIPSTGTSAPPDPDWRASVAFWSRLGLTIDDLVPMIEIAMTRTDVPIDRKWRYFCGVVWRTLDEIQDRAAARKATSTPASTDREDEAWDEGYRFGYADGQRDERRAFEAELNVRERLAEMHLDDASTRYGDTAEIRDALKRLFGDT